MIDSILNYDFLQNAIISGVLLGILLPIIGTIVLLRKMPFIADALGHINMSAIAFVYLLNTVLFLNEISSIVLVIIWSILGGILIEYISSKYKHYKDVSIMIVYSIAIAFTMIFLNFSSGFNDSFFNILFGNINGISNIEVLFLIVIIFVILIILMFNYKNILIISIDEENSKFYGVNLKFQRYLTIILISVSITLTIKIIGVLLVSSLILIPNLAAMRIAKNLKQSFIISICITQISILGGIVISYYLNLSSSAVIVLIAVSFYMLTILKQVITKK